MLLDFGSARHVVADRTQALTAMFKPSFAAIEQYGDVPGLRQGAWTDLYALGGVMHFMITGSPRCLRPCAPSMTRSRDLRRSPAGKGGVSIQLLEAIDWALAVRPDSGRSRSAPSGKCWTGARPCRPRSADGSDAR